MVGFGEFGERGERADAQAVARLIADAAQSVDLLDVDQTLGSDHVVLHQRQQIGAAGEDCALLAEQRGDLLFLGGADVFKRLHGGLR